MTSQEQYRPSLAYRWRWLIGLFAVAGVTLGIVGVSASLYHGEYWLAVGVAIVLLAQVALLSPKGNWTSHVATSGRPMRRTVLIASAMFAILTAGLLVTGLEVFGQWDRFVDGHDFLKQMGVALASLWLIWTIVFLFIRDWGPRYLRLRRIVRALIAGSVLEAITATTVLALAPDPDDCICARGSFLGLFFSGFVALWAFGPAAILVFWERKVQREFVRRRCEACQRRLANSIRAGFDHCRHCNAPLPDAAARQVNR